MKEKFHALSEQYFEEIVKTASEMIQIPSLSGEEKAMADYTVRKMKELGYDEVTVDEAGSVIGLMKGTGGGKSMMLNCHLDVVGEGPHERWQYAPYGGEVAEGKIWGRGASDTKGTFAAQVYAPYILKEAGLMTKGDIYVVGVVHEEDSGYGSQIMVKNGFKTDYAIVGEATENNIANACKGRVVVVATISGKSVHASIPHHGKNPFDFLGKFVEGVKEEFEPAVDPYFGKSIISPTKIESSEPDTNIIPNWVRVYFDYRSVPGETNESILAKVQTIADKYAIDGIGVELKLLTIPVYCYTGLEGESISGEPPHYIDENGETIQKTKQVLEELYDREVTIYPWAFATDSGHFSQIGVEVIGFSPAEITRCHTSEDNIDLEMLKEGIAGNLAIIKAFCE